MANLSFKQGEARTVTFTITENGSPVDLTGTTIVMGVKRSKADSSYTILIEDAEFDKSQEQNGIISCFINASDTNIEPGTYVLELMISFSNGVIEKTADASLIIQRAVVS